MFCCAVSCNLCSTVTHSYNSIVLYPTCMHFHHLGFQGAITALARSALDRADTNLPIYFDDVHCLGDEPALSYCINNGVGVHNCRHYEDAAVVCQGMHDHY